MNDILQKIEVTSDIRDLAHGKIVDLRTLADVKHDLESMLPVRKNERTFMLTMAGLFAGIGILSAAGAYYGALESTDFRLFAACLLGLVAGPTLSGCVLALTPSGKRIRSDEKWMRAQLDGRDDPDRFRSLNHPLIQEAVAVVQAAENFNAMARDWAIYAESVRLDLRVRDPEHDETLAELHARRAEIALMIAIISNGISVVKLGQERERIDTDRLKERMSDAGNAIPRVRAITEVSGDVLTNVRQGLQTTQLDRELAQLRPRIPTRQPA